MADNSGAKLVPTPWRLEVVRRSRWLPVIWFIRLKPMGAFGGFLLCIVGLLALTAPLLTPYDPTEAVPAQRLLPPSNAHLLGTDAFGRDVFSRVIYGARVSLFVGFLATVITTAGATVIGLATGYWGGIVDDLFQRLVDGVMALPFLILVLTVMMLIGNTVTNLGTMFGVIYAIRNSRVVRSVALGIKEEQYIDAARAVGCGPWRILGRHVLPNIFGPLMVVATVTWGIAILAESQVSFLGYGVPPPLPSWGRMVSSDGRQFLESAPWIAAFPGLAISIVVFGFNMFGDALRDVLDPRMRRG